jgi:hypothetical protein
MFAKRLLLVLAAIIVVFPSAISYAEGAALVQAYAWEESIDVFVTGSMNPDSLSCKVSNQGAVVVGSGLLVAEGITVRTTILLDISTSMPVEVRGSVKSYLDNLIGNIGKNEEYKIVTFGEQLNVLQDFSTDRYDLVNAAAKIEFNGQQSKIYDAIFNTIPAIQPLDGTPCYYRTIVITDGVDDTASGVTREELYLRLQAETYPIDIVAVSAAQQAEPNKDLAALTRMSGGRYHELSAATDIAALSANLAVSDVFWLRATIPGELLDGSTRQVNLTDGVSSVQFDLKVPVFDIPVEETTGNPANSTATNTTPKTNNHLKVFLVVGVVMLLAVLAAIVVLLRKKKESPQNDSEPQVGGGSSSNETEIITPHNNGNACIRLRNVSVTEQVWDLGLTKEALVGRDTSCQVCLPDKSVSRRQCRLYINRVPSVENLSNSNKTLLNGEPLNAPTALKVGDKLKCGHVTLLVESLYATDSQNVGDLNRGTELINV